MDPTSLSGLWFLWLPGHFSDFGSSLGEHGALPISPGTLSAYVNSFHTTLQGDTFITFIVVPILQLEKAWQRVTCPQLTAQGQTQVV